MAGVRMRIKGQEELSRKLHRAMSKAKNPREFMQVAGVKGFRDINDHFLEENGPKKPWKPLKFSRPKRKGQKAGRDKILQDTGRLRGSIRWKAFKNKVLFFTNVKYASDHQYGVPSRNLDARPFLWLSKGLVKDLAKKYVKFVGRDLD